MSRGRKRAEAPREHGVAQKRFAEIVGGVTESDDIRAQSAGDVVYGAAAESAAEIASVIRLFFEKPK